MNPKDNNTENSTSAIEIIVIGAGTSVPVAGYSPASIFIRFGAFSALLDSGPGTISKLPIYEIDAFELENIFITHLHPDHVLDLATFVQMSNYSMDRRSEIPLDIFSCDGSQKFYDEFLALFPDIEKPAFSVKIHEMVGGGLEKDGVRISSTLSGHTQNSVAFKLGFKTGSLVYTGDCIKNDDLINFCKGANILISECSFPDECLTNDHMNARDLGVLASSANVEQLIVVHQYPPAIRIDLASQISQHYSGPILIAKDGTRVTINLSSEGDKKC